MRKFNLTITEQQLNNISYCMDVALKNDGLGSLAMITDLHNLLLTVKEVALEEEQENKFKKDVKELKKNEKEGKKGE